MPPSVLAEGDADLGALPALPSPVPVARSESNRAPGTPQSYWGCPGTRPRPNLSWALHKPQSEGTSHRPPCHVLPATCSGSVLPAVRQSWELLSPATRPAAPRAASPLPFCSACVSAALPGALSPAGALGGPPRAPGAPTPTLSCPRRAARLTEAHLLRCLHASPGHRRVPPPRRSQGGPSVPRTPTLHPASPPHSSTGPARHAVPPPHAVSPSTVQALSSAAALGWRGRGHGALSWKAERACGFTVPGARPRSVCLPIFRALSPALGSWWPVVPSLSLPPPLPPLKVGGCPETTAGLHCPSASRAPIPLSLKTASDLPPRLLRLWVAPPRPCQGRQGRRGPCPHWPAAPRPPGQRDDVASSGTEAGSPAAGGRTVRCIGSEPRPRPHTSGRYSGLKGGRRLEEAFWQEL